ncbi:MAG: DUF1974 domain-containing protein [Oligoflexus sp.]|nr:DUF1974 domain-containing protein [Oligoflexus sp.]
MHAAVKTKRLAKEKAERLVAKAGAEGILTNAEVELVRKAEAARENLIQVDSFPLEGLKSNWLMPVPPGSKRSSAEPGEIVAIDVLIGSEYKGIFDAGIDWISRITTGNKHVSVRQ